MPYLIQRAAAAAMLVILSPLIIGLAAIVRSTSRGPAFFTATRVGRYGQPFRIVKLRTMTAAAGPTITAAADPRVTRVGRILRRTKLDELPQLLNVARGEMALVGPRPEDPRYVDLGDPLQQVVLRLPPGMTGPTALAFADEERLLREAARRRAITAGRDRPSDGDVDLAYRHDILPQKLRLDAEYVRYRSLAGDMAVVARTIGLVLRRSGGF